MYRINDWLPVVRGKSEVKWSLSVVSDSLRPHGLWPTRLLGPWDFPGMNTGAGCHFLFQGIFPTQGSNPGLLHCRQTLYCLSYQGSPTRGKKEDQIGPKKSVRDLRDAKVKVKGVSCSAVSDSLQSTDYSLPGSSVHGIFQGKNTGMGWHLLRQGIFPTNQTHISCVCLYWQLGSLPLAPPEWVA